MKIKNLVISLTIAAFFLTIGPWTGNAHATTILTFEDILSVPSAINEYAGFDWDGGSAGYLPVDPNNPAPMYIYSNTYYPGTAVSGTKFLYKGAYGYSPTITWLGSGTFDFAGAYFKSLTPSSNIVRFTGYNNGNLVYDTLNFSMNMSSATWIPFNWTGIDEIRTSQVTGGDNVWIMDDFTYSPTVPIPGAVLLLGSGFLCLIGFRRKINKQLNRNSITTKAAPFIGDMNKFNSFSFVVNLGRGLIGGVNWG